MFAETCSLAESDVSQREPGAADSAWTLINGRLGDRAATLQPQEYRAFDLGADGDRTLLHALGVEIVQAEGVAGNIVILPLGIPPRSVPLQLGYQGSNNVTLLGSGSNLTGISHFLGSDNVAVFMGGGHVQRVFATLYDDNLLYWGYGSRGYGVRIWVHGGTECIIDEDCLFSENINIRTTDHHAIIDLETRLQTNPPASVRIGRHVWVGEDCFIGKGVTIGPGSIIGGRSFVNRPVPAKELWAGSPARMVRQGVSWIDSSPSTPDQIDALVASMSDVS